jgi:hypothetical protein
MLILMSYQMLLQNLHSIPVKNEDFAGKVFAFVLFDTTSNSLFQTLIVMLSVHATKMADAVFSGLSKTHLEFIFVSKISKQPVFLY